MVEKSEKEQINKEVENADSALKRIDRVVLRCDFINREIKAYIKNDWFYCDQIKVKEKSKKCKKGRFYWTLKKTKGKQKKK